MMWDGVASLVGVVAPAYRGVMTQVVHEMSVSRNGIGAHLACTCGGTMNLVNGPYGPPTDADITQAIQRHTS